MKIAMIVSEASHFAKTGGLADVSYALSESLIKAGHEVILVLPYYRTIKKTYKGKVNFVGSYDVYMSWRTEGVGVYKTTIGGLPVYLLENNYYFDRDNLYGYDDDGERFAFFSLAGKSLLPFIKLKADIIHVHDWQTAMIPCLVKEGHRINDFFDHTKFVLTIHNPAFKGMIDRYFLNDFYGLPDYLYDNGSVRFEGMVSTLKSGIVYSDKVTTVSPTHREELLSVMGSQGLDGVLRLRERDFVGILNGIDVGEWDPNTDKLIKKTYKKATLMEGKKANQADLLASFNLAPAKGAVYGLVSRLTYQKGIDLIFPAMRKELKKGASFVVLGSGEYQLEQRLESLRREFPENVGIYIGYNENLAHKVYAGSDFFLMPSLYEPCGIGQLLAERYGTLPIVRYTGGLKDTVVGFNGENQKVATGIGFNDYNVEALEYALGLAHEIKESEALYYQLAGNAISIDNSWKKSAAIYERLYSSII